MTRFLLIRHATNDAVGKRLTGQMAGFSLNEQGRHQAELLAERLSHVLVHAVYTSPLERAIETAEPLLRKLNIKSKVSTDFSEVEVGEWTNRTIDELRNDITFSRFNTFRSCTRIPGGELMLESQVRMITGIEKILVQHPNETVAVISHGDLIKAAVAYYAGIHLDMFQRIEISPASVSVVDLGEDFVRILCVNNTGGISFD